MNPNALALGCAALGNDYGPAPVKDYGLARDIIHASYEGGVRWFDTAVAYGKSEEWLAKALGEIGAYDAQVVTKVYPAQVSMLPGAHCVLGHDGRLPETAKAGQMLGVSVYDIATAWQALGNPDTQAIQVPLNIFQTGFLTSGIIQEAVGTGRFTMVRSVLMRGILNSDPRNSIEWAQLVAPGAVVVVGADSPEHVRGWFA